MTSRAFPKLSTKVREGLAAMGKYPVPTVFDLERIDKHASDILRACAQHDGRMECCDSLEEREEEYGAFVNLMICKASAIRRALGAKP